MLTEAWARSISILKMIDIDYQLKRSKRKTISVEISREASIIVRAPRRMPLRDIEEFLLSKRDWVEKHLSLVRQQLEKVPEKLTEQEMTILKREAKKEIASRVSYYASLMGVEHGRIAIRAQKTRFGSCSSKKNLNFNIAIMLMPEEIRDYVIVHELAHLIEMNHSSRFWNEVAKVMPDYQSRRKWLKDNGIAYINRI